MQNAEILSPACCKGLKAERSSRFLSKRQMYLLLFLLINEDGIY